MVVFSPTPTSGGDFTVRSVLVSSGGGGGGGGGSSDLTKSDLYYTIYN